MKSRVENHKEAIISGKITVQVFADIEFGVLSKNCRNYGICRINIKAQTKEVPCEGALPRSCFSIITSDENGMVEMIFLKGWMSEASKKKYFGANFFQVDEDIVLPKEITEHTAAPDRVIKKGNYNVINQKGAYIVQF